MNPNIRFRDKRSVNQLGAAKLKIVESNIRPSAFDNQKHKF
jgi:hypothetical protein